jgi:hypothetical protein
MVNCGKYLAISGKRASAAADIALDWHRAGTEATRISALHLARPIASWIFSLMEISLGRAFFPRVAP